MILSGKTFRCTAGETFDIVALIVYGDEQYASELLSANPDKCTITMFSGGELLKLPVIEKPEEADSEYSFEPDKAPWKE